MQGTSPPKWKLTLIHVENEDQNTQFFSAISEIKLSFIIDPISWWGSIHVVKGIDDMSRGRQASSQIPTAKVAFVLFRSHWLRNQSVISIEHMTGTLAFNHFRVQVSNFLCALLLRYIGLVCNLKRRALTVILKSWEIKNRVVRNKIMMYPSEDVLSRLCLPFIFFTFFVFSSLCPSTINLSLPQFLPFPVLRNIRSSCTPRSSWNTWGRHILSEQILFSHWRVFRIFHSSSSFTSRLLEKVWETTFSSTGTCLAFIPYVNGAILFRIPGNHCAFSSNCM